MNSPKKSNFLAKSIIDRITKGMYLVAFFTLVSCSPQLEDYREIYRSSSLSIKWRLDKSQCVLIASRNGEHLDSIVCHYKDWPKEHFFKLYDDIDTVYVSGLHRSREHPVDQKVFIILSEHKTDSSFYGKDKFIFNKLSSLEGDLFFFEVPKN